jgi:hypothetical protein
MSGYATVSNSRQNTAGCFNSALRKTTGKGAPLHQASWSAMAAAQRLREFRTWFGILRCR